MVSARRYVFPEPGDTIATVAARELPGHDDAGATLLSWNLHLVLRRTPTGPDDELLGTEIVYLEPPSG